MKDLGGPKGRIWPWIVVPLLIVAAATVASALLLTDGPGLSDEGSYRVR
ncbi:MAG: hypothetical protein VX460_05975 [Planctomycetota bacterium]|nr:hypothetical protein [Planctomycetota bacterium]